MSKKRRKKKDRRPNIPQQTLGWTPGVTEDKHKRAVRSTHGFNPDYSYVIRDLKRIGILAGSFIILLIALSFVLR